MEEGPKVLILYASQTGNVLDMAKQVGREAERRGCPVKLLSSAEKSALTQNQPLTKGGCGKDVRHLEFFKHLRHDWGLCSTWLNQLDPEECTYIPIWFHKDSLPPSTTSLPLILIGPVTGCAPFHGFVEERSIQKAEGGGFYVAFSRNQQQKVYVQHKMKEYSRRLWNLLNQGAAVYVACSSTQMPSDVSSAFKDIVRWLRALHKAAK
ncbi:hypothetical protein FEM48_Zijuj12G0134700 [Ziziphus jujuba var. spinosa]|uniref:Flavodoxin-like domain-containing protein n=1 Tax=Ziziphus jujuba var. spinosa TaxID=714518 RepID=A0A978UDL4_ZIZJJ|nr:hypothetical protein FEM48_Zijuj12G0134700 [Ziziphus jujuba var. spinosa]